MAMAQTLLAVNNYGSTTHQNASNIPEYWHQVEIDNNSNIIDLNDDGFSMFRGNGLSMTVYRCDNNLPPPLVKDIFKIQNDISARLLIISTTFKAPTKGNNKQIHSKPVMVTKKDFETVKTVKKPKRTKGRKKVLYQTHFEYNGKWLEVNADEKKGFYPAMMRAFLKQFERALSIHKRLLVIRFDLHQKDHYTEDSKMITDFFERLKRKLESHYNGLHSIGNCWSRELEKVKAQHYHCALFVDYDFVRNPKVTHDKIRDTWSSLRDGNTCHIVKKVHKVHDELTKAEAIYHLSYLAKERGKGYRPPQSKDYGASRLKQG